MSAAAERAGRRWSSSGRCRADIGAFERLDSRGQTRARRRCNRASTSLRVFVTGFPAGAADAICTRRSRAPRSRRPRRCPSSSRTHSPPPPLQRIELAAARFAGLDRCVAVADGNHLARWLTALPPNVLDCVRLPARAAAARASRRLAVRVSTTRRRLRRLGAGAFLAVCARQRAARRRHRAADAIDRPRKRVPQHRARRQGHLLRHRRHQPEAAQEHVPDARRHAGQRRRASARCSRCRGSRAPLADRLLARDHRERDRPDARTARRKS